MPVVNGVTEARSRIGALITGAVHEHRPAVIERNHRDHCLLVSKEDVELLVANREFHPEVSMEAGAVNVWLPEFALYGRGEDFEAAKRDLVDEVRHYVDEYLANGALYLRAPNRAQHYPLIIKALIADVAGQLEEILFAPPAGVPRP